MKKAEKKKKQEETNGNSKYVSHSFFWNFNYSN
jgi:hypothetical protein